MHAASLQGFIKIVFYMLVFYFIMKFLAKLLLPVVVKKVVQKAEENFHQQYGSGQQPNPSAQPAPRQDRPRETKKVVNMWIMKKLIKFA